MGNNPLTKKPIQGTQELLNALNDLGNDLDSVRQKTIRYETTRRYDDEFSMILALSGLEIKCTNFATDTRERLA